MENHLSWTANYQLFLFDFDGLLVNTEELHFLAYKQMMLARGIELKWTFERYCMSAHYSSEKLQSDLFQDYPELKRQDPSWEHLYREKQIAMKKMAAEVAVQLMPGVETFLTHLQENRINHAVVTHSAMELIALVKAKHSVLSKIPHWITRYDYTHAKPNPECYEIAIKRYSKSGDKIIGFEDSPRGLMALLRTPATAVLITKVPYPEIPGFIRQGAMCLSSMEELYPNNFKNWEFDKESP